MGDYVKGAYNYYSDKISGDKGENVVARFLEQEKGFQFVRKSVLSESETRSDFDLLMHNEKGEEVTIEIKTDFYCNPKKDTGNLAIEHMRKGYKDETLEPTGIRLSKADFYVYYYWNLNEMWMAPTDKVRKLIKTMYASGEIEDAGGKRHKWMGDNKRSLSYLIPREKYRSHFTVFKFDKSQFLD